MNYPGFEYVKDVYYGINKVVVFINNDLLDLIKNSGDNFIYIDNLTKIIHGINNDNVSTCLDYILNCNYPKGKSVKDYFETITNIIELCLNSDSIKDCFEDIDVDGDLVEEYEENFDEVLEIFISDDGILYEHPHYYNEYYNLNYICERVINKKLFRIVELEKDLKIEEVLSIVTSFFHITNDNINMDYVDLYYLLIDYYKSCDGSYIIRRPAKSARN